MSECRLCLIPCNPEIHEATVRLHQRFKAHLDLVVSAKPLVVDVAPSKRKKKAKRPAPPWPQRREARGVREWQGGIG